MEQAERVRQIVAAGSSPAARMSAAYDEVVDQVAARAAAAGELGKLDLAALTAWKRLRADTPWMAELMGTPDDDVRRHTARAVAAARDVAKTVSEAAVAARAALAPLPGFRRGDALASAVCFAAAPNRLAVYDRRAHRGLVRTGLVLDNRPGRYGRYLDVLEHCRAELVAFGHEWSAREIDLAMYVIGR